MTRRGFVQASCAVGVTLSLAPKLSAKKPLHPVKAPPFVLSPERDKFLDELERRAAKFFYDEADPYTGQVKDRARTEGEDPRIVASIAATGFGLTALAIADRRGYLDRSLIVPRIERTLEFLLSTKHQHGFFYHFIDMRNGDRAFNCEVSSVDTAWLLCGILHAREHFNTPRIDARANELLDRVDWRWMLNGAETLAHGWTPERGFLPYRWDSYSELMAMYLLAIGSKTNPIPATSWDAWHRPVRNYAGLEWIDSDTPLFTHQYSHAWFDFRNKRDKYTDYFDNSCRATTAHRLRCISLGKDFPWYQANMWGVTASDSRMGYRAWGGIVSNPALDGTLVPCAAGGSLPFMPDKCMSVLETMMDRYGSKIWGRYGFADAFHPRADWVNPDVLGIDQGIMMTMAENLRTGSVWQAVMASPEAKRGLAGVELV